MRCGSCLMSFEASATRCSEPGLRKAPNKKIQGVSEAIQVRSIANDLDNQVEFTG
jgi:hypothetical protein